MPRLGGDLDQHSIGGGFNFSATKVDKLGATNYTLASLLIDESSSVSSFQAELDQMIRTVVETCKKSPQSDNILLRVCAFARGRYNNIDELIGFTPLADIDPAAFRRIAPMGSTPLNDAVYSGLASTASYAKTLKDSDFFCNGILFVMTDGEENTSTTTMAMIKAEQDRLRHSEELESIVSILIGVNATGSASYLANFQREAGMTQFIDAGSATPGKLAKLAAFVSTSIDSQSKAIGTGGPSQSIAATI